MPRRLPTGRVGARGCTTIFVILGLACSCVRVQARENSLKRSLLFLNMRGNTLMVSTSPISNLSAKPVPDHLADPPNMLVI